MSVVFKINLKSRKQSNPNVDNGLYLKGSNGAAVILVHGLTGSPQEMKFLAEFLNAKGYSVICPRLANHGAPIEILKRTKWQEFYKSVRAAFLEAAKDNKFVFAAGLSMSALLVLLLADEFGDRVSAVSCLSPTIFYDGWNTPWYRCFLPLLYFTPLIKRFLYFKEEPPYGIKNKQMQRLVHRHYRNVGLDNTEQVAKYGYPYFPVTLFYQSHLLVKYISKKLSRIRVPVQLIQARDDDMTSIRNSQFIFDAVKSEKKEIVLLEDSYHVITVDQEREKVAENLENFFKKSIL